MIAVKYLDVQSISKLGMKYIEISWIWDAALETFIEKRVDRVYGFMQAAQNTRDSIYQQSNDVLFNQVDLT